MNIEAEIQPPGDKSLSHRAAIFSSLAEGESLMRNFLRAGDTMNTLKAFQKLGVRVEDNGAELKVVSPGIAGFHGPEDVIDAGNSGTGARLMLGLFAGLPGISATISGDQSLVKRPMKRVTEPLRRFGADFSAGDFLPLQVRGGSLQPVTYTEELGSAQVKSALMLAALASGVPLSLTEKKPSRDHTENMLRFAGVPVTRQSATISMNPPYRLQPRIWDIWGDISSAAFFIVLALLSDTGSLTIRNVLLNPFRDGFIRVLKKMGADIEIIPGENKCGETGGDLIVRPSKLHGIAITAEDIPSIIDELPILTIAGIFSEGEFSFRGAEELRVKESDRISALVNNLKAAGISSEEFSDGLKLRGNPKAKLSGGVTSYHDHRIIMSFEIANLRSRANGASADLSIDDASWIETSFPDFYSLLKKAVRR